MIGEKAFFSLFLYDFTSLHGNPLHVTLFLDCVKLKKEENGKILKFIVPHFISGVVKIGNLL